MIYVIYVFAGLFIALCVTMLYVFFRNRHLGFFLMGVTYGTSGLLAIMLPHWWPLIAGLVLVWLLRFMGLEPYVEPKEDDSVENTESQSQSKDKN